MIVFVIIIQMTTRSNHQRCSVRKSVLRNFAKFTGKHLCQVLFYNKGPATLLKKRLWHRCFPMIFVKFLRTPFHRTPLNDCFSTIQHFLAENPSKVLNGQQQHKGVTFHWSKISSLLVTVSKLFTTIIFYHVGQTPPEACSEEIEKNEMIKSIMKM